MDFSTYSEKWKFHECKVQPSELLRLLLQACSRRLPPDALGHAKAFAEFTGGRAFASTTLTPADVTIRNEGQYEGGVCEMGVTLIFMGLPRPLLQDVLIEAADEVFRQSGCVMIKRTEE